MTTLNLEEASALLKIHPQTARQLAAQGEIPGAQIGRSWVFLEDELLGYLRDQTRAQMERRRQARGLPVQTRKKPSRRKSKLDLPELSS